LKFQINHKFWAGKKVFVTGHTGFKGSWLCLWLQSMGAHVKGYSLEPPTTPSLFNEAKVEDGIKSDIGDIRDKENIIASMIAFNPDILIHMAAQPLVRLSYLEPVDTYSTNVMGTVHVLEAARQCHNLKAIVNVTTDKCYENKEWEWGYRESEPMGGYDPYSNSKGCAELVSSAYRQSFFQDPSGPRLASARAGNVIGGGDWALGRLSPDVLRAFEKQQAVVIRNPLATRPWQHVLEPLSGYLALAEALYNDIEGVDSGWNFGPCDEDVMPVEWILTKMTELWGGDASWALTKNAQPHEAKFLKLDISKAKSKLYWFPTWKLETTLERIVNWHQSWLSQDDMQKHCMLEIQEYMLDMKL